MEISITSLHGINKINELVLIIIIGIIVLGKLCGNVLLGNIADVSAVSQEHAELRHAGGKIHICGHFVGIK